MKIGVTATASMLAVNAAPLFGRDLGVTMTTSSARACRANCIDQNQYFCANEDFSEGVCCDTSDETCRQTGGMCSFDLASSGYEQSQYFICPFDTEICGLDRLIQVSDDQSAITVTNLGYANSSDFIFGQVCAYELLWPESSKDGDLLVVTAL